MERQDSNERAGLVAGVLVAIAIVAMLVVPGFREAVTSALDGMR